MLLALTGMIASGVTLAFVATGAAAPASNVPVSAPTIVDTGFSSSLDPASTAQFQTCTLIDKNFDVCVWDYNGVWVLDSCDNPPSPICPRG